MQCTPSRPFRIVVVDDESSIRQGLRLRLNTEPDLHVVGATATGTESVDLVRELQPDVVLMDVRLPDMSGFEATKALHRACPAIPVVILTLHDDAAARTRARQVGAAAFVSKHDGDATLLATIRRVLHHA